MPRSFPPTSSASSALDTLLILSRTLTGAKQGGLLADALDLMLGGIGCAHGIAYAVGGDALELVGERGLPTKLRASLERLPLTGSPWTPAQAAAQTRKLVVGHDLGVDGQQPAPASSRWSQVVSCPIASGREVYGVLVFAWPAGEPPDPSVASVVEVACNMMAIQMARRNHEQRRVEARGAEAYASRMAALGIVAGGVAEDLDEKLADAARRLPFLEALRPAREATTRFLSAIAQGAPERLDLCAIVADAVALTATPLARRRISVELEAEGPHLVVGRRGELIQLFLQIVLGISGVLEDTDGICSDRSALIPRAFAIRVHRQGGHEMVTLHDAGDDGTGARASFFEIGGHARVRDLDLTVARQIVIAHEGHIEIGAAGPPGGTQCTVVLPAAATDVERHAARPKQAQGAWRPPPNRPRPVLLWVDEDDLFLEIMVQSLPDLEVRVARSAADASQFLAYGAIPALVLCNVRLPDKPGHELHAELARHSPKVADRFVFVADGLMTPEIASYIIASGRPTLMRPIDLEKVKALCARDPAAAGTVAAAAPTLAETRTDLRRAPTVPAFAAISQKPDDAGDHAFKMGETPKPPPPAFTMGMGDTPKPPPDGGGAGMREHELAGIARAAAELLRREGPKRGAVVTAMLRVRGLSDPEALAVITYALSTGILVRDPPPSAVLRVPDATPSKTVLVVDDDHDLRQTLREVLQDEGYRVETAANGKEALDLLHRSNPPRVMVLDLMMPVMDGWQLLDALKGDDSLADIPVVVISAGKAVNAPSTHDFLSKPLDYYKLVTTLERSMQRTAAPR